MFVTVTVLFLAVVGLLLVLASRVSIVSILVLQLAASIFGMWLLADSGQVSWSVFVTYAFASTALIGGRLLAGRRRPGPPAPAPAPAPATTALPYLSTPVMWSLVVVSSTLAFYHLYMAGIPILGSNVEIQRFDFTSSGLFGVPGRMFLFGLKITWVVASANAVAQRVRWTSYPPWIASSVALLVASLASGFKGQVLSLAVIVLIVWRLTHQKPFTYWSVVRRFWPLGLVAVGYFLVVATQYGTYRHSQLSVLESAFNRWTTGSAETPALVLSNSVATVPGNALVNDLLYYAARYAGIGPGAPFSLERAVSASITAVNPVSAVWVVPVNVGGYAELVSTFGVPSAIAAMAFVGFVLGRMEMVPPTSTVRTSVRIIAVLVITSVVVKGGLVYSVVNWSSVAALLLLVGLLAHLIFDRSESIHHTARVTPPPKAGCLHREPTR